MKFNTKDFKVTHIVWGMGIGGTENMLVDIINKQVNTNNVSLVVIDKGYNTELLSRLDNNVNVLLLNRTPGKKDLAALIKLNFILLFRNIQIIHCHTPSLLDMLPIINLLPAKICVTVHDTNINYSKLYKYNKIFSISPSVKCDILNRSNIDSLVIINGINFENVKKKIHTRQENKPMSIVQVSRLDHEKKGQALLIRALHEIVYKHNIPDIKVTFIGDGPSKQYLIDLAQELTVLSHCNFSGPQNRDYVYATLKDYDLLVQPSYFEGFGLTVTEGIAAMIPVLVSDIEGPADIIQNGKYGYMFKKGSVSDLTQKILEVMADRNKPDLKNKMEINYQYAKKRFDVSNTAESYNREYVRLLK